MAYSKTFLLLGLVFAVVLLVSSEVSARELAQETEQTDAVNEDKYHDHDGDGDHHDHDHHDHDGGHGAAGKKLEETDRRGRRGGGRGRRGGGRGRHG
ncbi:dormancy-associated protein 2-like isoform X2 [Quercus robur]|uniref:dormancy-associated protein 2-like isoform X2 n=1 Tax=Quercus robur TaxID=38942 RepID=UPI002163B0F8|nr:dormancy-associated protein 2-like isoform X2 [Quercus robur]